MKKGDEGSRGSGGRRGRQGGGGKKPRKPNPGIAKKRDLGLQVAMEVFQNGRSPLGGLNKIAKDRGLTVPAIWALLHGAFANGHIAVHIFVEEEFEKLFRLQTKVRRQFPKLRDVLLVPGFPEMLETNDRGRLKQIHSQVIDTLAWRVSLYLDMLLEQAAPKTNGGSAADFKFRLGVAWGTTMHKIAQRLATSRRALRAPFLYVLPIIGPTWASRTEPVEANLVAMDIARSYGGASAQLPAPAFVEWRAIRELRKLRPVAEMLEEIAKCDVILTGMGAIRKGVDSGEMVLTNDRNMRAALYNGALSRGAIGEICYWLWDKEGAPVGDTDYESVGLGYNGLKKIAADEKRKAVVVTGGDLHRIDPLRVALKAGLASVLVTDTVTASCLVGETKI